jgi:hypothetical protein
MAQAVQSVPRAVVAIADVAEFVADAADAPVGAGDERRLVLQTGLAFPCVSATATRMRSVESVPTMDSSMRMLGRTTSSGSGSTTSAATSAGSGSEASPAGDDLRG